MSYDTEMGLAFQRAERERAERITREDEAHARNVCGVMTQESASCPNPAVAGGRCMEHGAAAILKRRQERAERQREADHSGREERVTSVEEDIARLTAHRAHGYSQIQETTAEEDSETHVTDTTIVGDAEVSSINPAHYRSDPSGVECIELARHMMFAAGNALKYIWRLGQKDEAIQELGKAVWYLRDAKSAPRVTYDGDWFSKISRVIDTRDEVTGLAMVYISFHRYDAAIDLLEEEIRVRSAA